MKQWKALMPSSGAKGAASGRLKGWIWAYRRTLVGACGLFALSGWLTVTTVTYFTSYQLWFNTISDMRDLEESYSNLLTDSQRSAFAVLDQLETFETASQQQRVALAELAELRRTLGTQLANREHQLEQITDQRNQVRTLVEEFEKSIAGADGLLHSVEKEKTSLKQRLAALQLQVREISEQRDTGRRVERGLRWRVAELENQLGEARSGGKLAQTWLKDWVMGSADALQQLVSQTGLDVEEMIARANDSGQGQGGPFQLVNAASAATGAQLPSVDPLATDFQRLTALQKLARSLPLGSPLDHYNLTSSFGKRRDPITGEWAFHGGLDFGAAPNSKIRAPAGGRVVHAGPLGPYGNTVEIDHGMGVTTRFGHLKSVAVEVGEQIELRQVIGVIGSTGRSTGRHLHYEVRVDGTAQDPAKFLNTGRYLVWAFEAGQS
jgi:septal ring factor EnvC (AmiA/AmiB activator)